MVKITKRKLTSPSRGDRSGPNPTNSIRVSRTTVRPVRIHDPQDEATVNGWGLVVRGTANPGDWLRMECGDLQPLLCKVNVNGQWTMAAVRLTAGSHQLTVTNATHPDRFASTRVVVSPLVPISVISPRSGETVETKHLEVTGKAYPYRLVCLRAGHNTLTQRADVRGSFRFSDVELQRRGVQRLQFYYAEAPSEGTTQVVINWPGLDFPSIVDPVTRAHLKPGGDIDRCASCYTHCYRATWTRMGRCPRCLKITEYWERPSPRFHALRPDLRNE